MFKSIFVLSPRLFSEISQVVLLIIQTREQKGCLGRKTCPIHQLEDNALSSVCCVQGSP